VNNIVSIIIPAYNEEGFIARCLDSLLANDYPLEQLEILVLDGMSQDSTPVIVEEYSRKYNQVKLIENEYRVQVKGLNKGLRLVQGKYILRCDAHCEYPKNYILELVGFLERNEADNVGGAIETLPSDNSISARAIACAMNHPFGVGLSFRTRKASDKPVVVDTIPFGAWRKETLDKLGAFDEDFVRAQDLELNIRLKKSGGRIVLLPWLITKYYARNTLRKLTRLSYQMGYAKSQIAKKHRCIGSYRQLFPPTLVLGLPVTFFSGLVAFLYGLYLLMAVVFAGIVSVRSNNILGFPVIVLSFLIMHFSYGVGYLKGFFDNFVIGRGHTDWTVTR
jgi:cellulose synthase/poly-beta-1,6-N-acetylglucosamine synthase-like glycosyltransferase